MVYFLIGTNLIQKNNEETWRRIQTESAVGQVPNAGSNGSGKPITLEKESFNMGNLDFLWFMENQLSKLDTQIESNLKKIEKQVDEMDKTHRGFQIDTREEGRRPIETYIYNFKWDDTKYPRTNLNEVYKNMTHRVLLIEAEFRNKTQAFNDKRNALSQLNKKEGSNFVTKDLAEILKKPVVNDKDFVYSDYLATGVVVVPKFNLQAFQAEGENVSEYIVPGTIKQFRIDDDDSFSLWRIIYFKSAHEEIANELKNKFKSTLREFTYDPNESQRREAKRNVLKSETEQLTKSVLELCDRYYSDLFSAYVHLKVLRLLIDSVLRYGIKERIFTCIIKPYEGKEKKVHAGLTKIFADPNQAGMYGAKEEIDDSEDFYPYAFVQINAPEKKKN